jgi:hypothetical protein
MVERLIGRKAIHMTPEEKPDLTASEQVEILDRAIKHALAVLSDASDDIENAMAALAQALGE